MTVPNIDETIHRITSVQGAHVRLRPVNRIDLIRFYEWRSSLASLPTWTTGFRRLNSLDEFVPEFDAWLKDSVTLVVIDKKSDQAIGFARAYHVNVADGWAWLQGFAVDEYRYRRHVAEASALFATYLFQQFPLRKVCSEIFAFNTAVIRIHEKLGFREAGRLTQHIWYGDRYWDLVQFEMFRDGWQDAMRRYSFLTSIETDLEKIVAAKS